MTDHGQPTLAARVAGQLRHNRTVLANAGSMMAAVLVTALLGMAFWLVAARHFPTEAVGFAAAAVAAMTLLGYLASLGLGTLLMGELPRRDSHHRGLLNAALVLSGGTGVALGLGFVAAAPLLSADLAPLGETWFAALAFATGVGLTSLAVVLDQALIGLMRGVLQLLRNVAFALAKLAALLLVGLLASDAGGVPIYATWALGIAVSLLVLVRFYRRRGDDGLRPRFGLLAAMRVEAAAHHLYNLAIRAPDLALPLIVVTLLSAEANADFYVAWMIASFGLMVPVSLGSVLFAVGSGDPEGLRRRYRFSIGLSLVLGLAANLFLLLAGSPILSLFGPSYEQGALAPLHILALGVFPEVVKAHYLSIARLQRRLRQTMPVVIGGTALELACAAAGGLTGNLTMVAAGWLAATCVEAVVMAPTVVSFVRPAPPRSPQRTAFQSGKRALGHRASAPLSSSPPAPARPRDPA